VAVLAAKFRLGLTVLAARFGGRFCGPDGPVATFGNVFLPRLELIRAVTFRSIRSSRATASFVRI